MTLSLDSGLEPGTAYSYRVRAFNSQGSSPYSSIATAATASVIVDTTLFPSADKTMLINSADPKAANTAYPGRHLFVGCLYFIDRPASGVRCDRDRAAMGQRQLGEQRLLAVANRRRVSFAYHHQRDGIREHERLFFRCSTAATDYRILGAERLPRS